MADKLFTLTTLTFYLNSKYKNKKTGRKFTISDTQHYIKRGSLPKYLGNVSIETIKEIKGINLYKIKDNAVL